MVTINRPQPPDPNSRASRKDDLEVIRKLGMTVVALTPGKFAKLAIPDRLRLVLTDARRFSGAAKQRQLKLVQAEIDEYGIDNMRADLDRLDDAPAPKPEPTERDRLASQLLEGGDAAVFALAERYDPTQLQTLRQAVRQARKAVQAGKTPDVGTRGISQCLSALR